MESLKNNEDNSNNNNNDRSIQKQQEDDDDDDKKNSNSNNNKNINQTIDGKNEVVGSGYDDTDTADVTACVISSSSAATTTASAGPTLAPSMMLDIENDNNNNNNNQSSAFQYTVPTPPVVVNVTVIDSTNDATATGTVTGTGTGGNDDSNIPMATATAIGSLSTSAIQSQLSIRSGLNRTDLPPEAITKLRTDQGFPLGLAEELATTRTKYPIRFWIVDNSGSMRSSDGTQIRIVSSINNNHQYAVVPCTRWIELQSAVEYHIRLAGIIDATTYFRLLNDPGPTVGMQEFVIGEQKPISSSTPSSATATPYVTSLEEDVNIGLSTIRATSPNGVTPLVQHIREIHERIQQVEHQLRNSGQQAVVVIATDGLPSDNSGYSNDSIKHELTTALSKLQKLPVWIVIRLCTDEKDVVSYYNELDSVLELQLEVIDDFFGEAKEIHRVNKWLTYGLPIHRCREMGYQHRIFDLLDERVLNKDELYEFCILMFGSAAFREAPNLHVNWKGFVRVLENIVKAEGKTYSPHTKKMEYWINIKRLNNIYGGGWFGLRTKR